MTSPDDAGKVPTTVRLDPAVYKWLREFAFGCGLSQSFVVEEALRLARALHADDRTEFDAILTAVRERDAGVPA